MIATLTAALWIWLGAALATLVHELGHIVGARAVGQRILCVELGALGPALQLLRSPVSILLRPLFLLGGSVTLVDAPARLPARTQALFVGAGPAANLLASIGLLASAFALGSTSVLALAALQLLYATSQLLPIAAVRSDGAMLWRALRELRHGPGVP